MLELQDISLKINGKEILKKINIHFEKNKIYALVGPNGAGKSTLAYVIMGLDGYRNIEGDIIFEGKSIKNLSIDERAKRGITLAWQEPARYEGLTVEKYLLVSAKKKDKEELKKALETVGLNADYLKRALDKTLSGGERKKIELASILLMKPKLVMLDEPDSGIDIASLNNIFKVIKLLKEEGITVILITHSLAVLKQAEDAILMCNGIVVEKGSKEKIVPYFEKKCIPCPYKKAGEGYEC